MNDATMTSGKIFLVGFGPGAHEHMTFRARAAIAGLLGATPDDPLANFHLRRLLNGQTGVAVDLR